MRNSRNSFEIGGGRELLGFSLDGHRSSSSARPSIKMSLATPTATWGTLSACEPPPGSAAAGTAAKDAALATDVDDAVITSEK